MPVNGAAKAVLAAFLLLAPWGIALAECRAADQNPHRDPPVSGDWVVNSPESYSGQAIMLAGNLTVVSGGVLSLSNVKLKMASPFDGAYHIEVQAGGEVVATDRDGVPTPLDDATVFSSGSSFAYQFWVRPGARLTMRNCVVQDCGFAPGARGETAGLYLQSGNCDFSNTTFKQNFCGMAVDGCAPRLDNCTFLDNRKYGMEIRDARLTIACNLFDQNTLHGLNVTGSDIVMERNNIRGNYRYGINASGSNLSLEGNIFMLNKWRAIYAENCCVTLHSDEFYNNGYQNNGLACMVKGASLDIEGALFQDNPYSLHCEDSNVVMRNTTMVNSTIYDIWLTKTADHSEVVSYNCSFKKAGYNDQLSWLEARWNMVLDVAWESTGAPVKGSTVRFFDRAGNNLFNLTSNETGALGPLVMSQYRENKTGRNELSPFRLLFNKDALVNRTFITLDRDIRQTLYLDDVPPYFKVTSPKENYTTNRPWINVTGAFNATWKNLTVNGEEVRDARFNPDPNFTVKVDLAEGINVINLTATDDFYNTHTVLRTVRRDSTPPSLSVDLAEEGILLNSTTYTLRGRTDPGSFVSVNGLVPTIGEDGSFEILLELAEGANAVAAASSDQYLNTAWVNRTIVVDTVAPFIEFTSPRFTPIASPQPPPAAGELWTNKPLLRLQGNTEAGSTVFYGNESFAPSGTNITITVNLTEGENMLQLRSRDRAGNWNSTRLLVHLDTVMPSATVLYPPDGAQLKDRHLVICGTAEPGVTVGCRDGAIDQNGTDFWVDCNLSVGPNLIMLDLRDIAGNARKMAVNVTLDVAASLRLDRPLNYTTVEGAFVRVEGLAEPGASVMVNDEPAVVAQDGFFSARAALETGPNIITINVTDRAGNMAMYQVVVFRGAPAAAAGGWLTWLVVALVAAAAASVAATGAWLARRRKSARESHARPRRILPWEEGFERPVIRAYEGPAEVLRCLRCGQPVSDDWISCHGCEGPADLASISAETFSRLAATEFQGERERGLKAALLRSRADISTVTEAGQHVTGQLRQATVAAQMLLRAQRPDIVDRVSAELGAELGPMAARLGAVHAREVAQTRQQAMEHMRAIMDEVEGAFPAMRAAGADVRDMERALEMARVHIRAENLEKAYEYIVGAKAQKDLLVGPLPPQ